MLVRLIASLFVLFSAATMSAHADEARDAKFLKKIEGSWRGPGEIVAGKYKGTRFTCHLNGSNPDDSLGMGLKGDCRVGVFTQKMEATVRRVGKTYLGEFLDGALGEGLDVVAGNITDDRIVLTLNRKELNGAMLARLANDNQLNVTVSVRVGEELVPVIGMSLDRLDDITVSSTK